MRRRSIAIFLAAAVILLAAVASRTLRLGSPAPDEGDARSTNSSSEVDSRSDDEASFAGVRGAVVDADTGRPVGGVEVVLLRDDDRDEPPLTTTSDEDGRFERRDLPPGAWTIRVDGGGYQSARDPAAWLFVVPEGGLEGVEIAVRRVGVVVGSVRDASGKPVAGMEVRAFPASAFPLPLIEKMATTSADGSFRIDALPPGVTEFSFPGGPRYATVRAGVSTPLDIRLGPARVYPILVVDAETSLPIERACLGRYDLGHEFVDERHEDLRTDAHGRMKLAYFGPSARSITVYADGYAESRPIVYPVSGRPLRFALRPVPSIRGRVVDPDDGSPVSDVAVREIGRSGYVRSDDAGAFVLELAKPGDYTIGVRHGRDVEVTAPADGVVLEALPIRVIRVLDPDGEPVRAGGYLYVVVDSSDQWGKGLLSAAGEFRTRTSSSAAGLRVELGRLSASARGVPLGEGTYFVRADANGDAVVRVEPAAPIVGRVVDPGGKPVEGARLSIATRHFGRSWAVTDSDGAFSLVALRAGARSIRVAPPRPDLLPRTADVIAGGPETTVRLEPAVSGTVIVEDSAGHGLEGVSVHVSQTDDDGGGHRHVWDGGATDADGSITFSRLDPNCTYYVGVRPSPESGFKPSGSKWRPPEPLTITLASGWYLTGIVVDEEGVPIADAKVSFDELDVEIEVPRQGEFIPDPTVIRTDTNGRFRTELLMNPRVWVSASDEAWSESDSAWTEADATDRDVRLVARRSVTLELDLPGAARGRAVSWFDEAIESRVLGRIENFRYDDHYDPFPAMTVPSEGPMSFGRLGLGARHTFWIPMPEDEHYVLLTGVRGDAGRVAAKLQPGAPLSGIVRSKSGLWRMVAVRGALRVSVRFDERGRFDVRGLPPGEWKLIVLALPFGKHTFAVRTGVPAELEIEGE